MAELDTLIEHIDSVKKEAETTLISSKKELEQYRIQFIGSKGKMKSLFGLMKDVPKEEKRNFGQLLNAAKVLLESKYETELSKLQTGKSESSKLDLTRPGDPLKLGSRHPVSLVKNQIIEIFNRIGYAVAEGPEIELDWYNFTALNFPPNHPARDMQDTYFVQNNPDIVLRTHTSSVQIREMEKKQPPIRIIMPGRVYRNETISARSHCFFHQVEGLYIDKNVSFADLKQTLLYFAKEFFGEDAKIRLRPSYFPFTEPSAEMDVWLGLETEKDKRLTKGTGWMEIMGCGMVDPNVLDNCDIDSKVYTGFAFGMGVDRIVLSKYDISDIRLLSENDVRFLDQFISA